MKTKTPIDPKEPRLTTAQAAPLIGLSVWTVKEKCAAGLIRATKIGRRWFIPESAIAEAINQGRN